MNPKGYSAQGFPRMDIAGYPTLYTTPGGIGLDDHDWGYADTLTWSRGRHMLKFGGEYKPQSRFQGNIPEGTYGSFVFNGTLTGYGYSDFLLGLPFQSTRLDPLTNRTTRDSELGIFVTDSFKATSRLTLDLGLRWDRFGSPRYEDGLMYNWDPATGAVIIPAEAQSAVRPLYPKNITVEHRRRVHESEADQLRPAYRSGLPADAIRRSFAADTESLTRRWAATPAFKAAVRSRSAKRI